MLMRRSISSAPERIDVSRGCRHGRDSALGIFSAGDNTVGDGERKCAESLLGIGCAIPDDGRCGTGRYLKRLFGIPRAITDDFCR